MATKTVRSKAAAGNGRVRRIDKSELKRANASETSRQLARVRRRLAPIELHDLEGSGDLPFVARKSPFINPTHDDGDAAISDYQVWPVAVCEIADAALRRGYRLLVRCRPDCAVPATAIIVNQLRGPVRVWWNRNHSVLIVGLLKEDQVQDEGASEES